MRPPVPLGLAFIVVPLLLASTLLTLGVIAAVGSAVRGAGSRLDGATDRVLEYAESLPSRLITARERLAAADRAIGLARHGTEATRASIVTAEEARTG